jgi:Na+/proline symporter
MEPSVIWLFALTGVYWSYCLFWGVKGYLRARTASDYFIAGRTIPTWVFVLAATATSFSGWTFVGHPALVWRDGLQYAFASFYVITIPFTGTIFLKRIWMMGKRHGYITPGEMYGDYLNSEVIRVLTVVVALIFSVPYLGLQLRASGVLFNVLSHDTVSATAGMWALALVVVLYVALGGLRSVAYVDTAQCILLMAGICVIGVITLVKIGGWEVFTATLHGMIGRDMAGNADLYGRAVLTPDGYHRLVAIPGPIQFVSNLGASRAQGGAWTGTMILTYMFGLMGIQASPAFTMWGFANTNPKPFAPQQVWASSLGVGACLFLFTALQGLGGWVLIQQQVLPAELLGGGRQEALVPALINLVTDSAPILVGVLAVCALAAMQSTGSAYLSTASGMITRDIYLRYINPRAGAARQKLLGRALVLVVCLLALLVATFSEDALVMLGGLAVSFGTQMWIPLAATLYFPWLTRQGVVAGLCCGLLGVLLTYPFNIGFMIALHNALGFGPYPLTIHCAGWGILLNGAVAVIVSAVTQPDKKERDRRMEFHDFLRAHASVPAGKAHLKAVGWVIVGVWFLFAIGPFATLGNNFFLFDAADPATWPLGMPPLWLWQVVWWLLGVYMMYFLAYKLELSTHQGQIQALRDDIAMR